MARIKINELQQDVQISKEEMSKVMGGAGKSLTQSYQMYDSAQAGDNIGTRQVMPGDHITQQVMPGDHITKLEAYEGGTSGTRYLKY